MPVLVERSFRLNLRLMRAFHLYPPQSSESFHKVQAHTIYLLFVVLIPTCEVLHVLLATEFDLEKFKYNAALLAESLCFIVKLLPLIKNGNRIKGCVDYLETPLYLMEGSEQRRLVDECVKVCRRNTVFFSGSLVVALCFWIGRPFFWKDRQLPSDVWLPFDPTAKVSVYLFVYGFIATGTTVAVLGASLTDTLITGLAYHATTQIKILKDNLQQLQDSRGSYSKIKRNVQHHDSILRFAGQFEDCFSWILFSQIFTSVILLGVCCLELSQITTINFYFMQCSVYLVCTLCQIYFYCYYGSTLLEESSTLTDSIYMSQWYDFDAKSKKALISFMERARKPIAITVGKTVVLSLPTFVTIVRRSYSLLAVLKG